MKITALWSQVALLCALMDPSSMGSDAGTSTRCLFTYPIPYYILATHPLTPFTASILSLLFGNCSIFRKAYLALWDCQSLAGIMLNVARIISKVLFLRNICHKEGLKQNTTELRLPRGINPIANWIILVFLNEYVNIHVYSVSQLSLHQNFRAVLSESSYIRWMMMVLLLLVLPAHACLLALMLPLAYACSRLYSFWSSMWRDYRCAFASATCWATCKSSPAECLRITANLHALPAACVACVF